MNTFGGDDSACVGARALADPDSPPWLTATARLWCRALLAQCLARARATTTLAQTSWVWRSGVGRWGQCFDNTVVVMPRAVGAYSHTQSGAGLSMRGGTVCRSPPTESRRWLEGNAEAYGGRPRGVGQYTIFFNSGIIVRWAFGGKFPYALNYNSRFFNVYVRIPLERELKCVGRFRKDFHMR